MMKPTLETRYGASSLLYVPGEVIEALNGFHHLSQSQLVQGPNPGREDDLPAHQSGAKRIIEAGDLCCLIRACHDLALLLLALSAFQPVFHLIQRPLQVVCGLVTITKDHLNGFVP